MRYSPYASYMQNQNESYYFDKKSMGINPNNFSDLSNTTGVSGSTVSGDFQKYINCFPLDTGKEYRPIVPRVPVKVYNPYLANYTVYNNAYVYTEGFPLRTYYYESYEKTFVNNDTSPSTFTNKAKYGYKVVIDDGVVNFLGKGTSLYQPFGPTPINGKYFKFLEFTIAGNLYLAIYSNFSTSLYLTTIHYSGGSPVFTGTTVTLPFQPVGNLQFLDGTLYCIGKDVTINSSQRIYNSNVGDPTTWSLSNNFIDAEIEGDSSIQLGKFKQHLLVFGRKTIEFFYTGGNSLGSPLVRRAELVKNFSIARNTETILINDALIFIGSQVPSTGNQGFSVCMMNEYFQLSEISDAFVNMNLNRRDNVLGSETSLGDTENFDSFYGVGPLGGANGYNESPPNKLFGGYPAMYNNTGLQEVPVKLFTVQQYDTVCLLVQIAQDNSIANDPLTPYKYLHFCFSPKERVWFVYNNALLSKYGGQNESDAGITLNPIAYARTGSNQSFPFQILRTVSTGFNSATVDYNTDELVQATVITDSIDFASSKLKHFASLDIVIKGHNFTYSGANYPQVTVKFSDSTDTFITNAIDNNVYTFLGLDTQRPLRIKNLMKSSQIRVQLNINSYGHWMLDRLDFEYELGLR